MYAPSSITNAALIVVTLYRFCSPYVDKSGVDMLAGGGTYLIGHRINGWAAGGGQSILRSGPMAGVNTHMILHAYDSVNGAPWATISPITWGADGWPVAWTA